MRIIARGTLTSYVNKLAGSRDQPAVETALSAWFHDVEKGAWANSADVKRQHASASIVNASRIVFNIKGNDHRLVVSVNYRKSIVWIIWIVRIKSMTKSKRRELHTLDDLRPIRTTADYKSALAELATLWEAADGTPESDRLDILATLIEKYEELHFPIDVPDPIDAILFRMEQRGLSRRDLEPMLGPRGRVAEVLNRKRGLSIEMIRSLHENLGIPAEVLIRPTKITAGSP